MEPDSNGDSVPHEPQLPEPEPEVEPDQDGGESSEVNVVQPSPKPGRSYVIPVHWTHHRRESYNSINEDRPAAITLEDHTEGPDADDEAVWAKAIYIQDYVVISGSLPSVGSFVVWHCRIETLDGASLIIRKRYSEFFDLRRRLLATFPNSSGAMPPFPRKTLIHRFQPAFLETRRVGLGYWLTCVLLNPEFCSSPVTKEFIFG